MQNLKRTTIQTHKFMSLMLHFFGRVTNLFTKVRSNEFIVTIHYKEEEEEFTEADWIIEKMFENYMAKFFPQIQIVGEEDTSNNLIKESEYFIIEDEKDINFDLIKESDLPDEIKNLDPEDLCTFIDPIDSTKSFIKRKFEPVTSLVGLTLKGEAFIGFMHFPYYLDKENNSLCYFNIPSKGVFCYDTNTKEIKSVSAKKRDLKEWIFISSSTRTNDQMKNVIGLFENGTNVQASGLGNKSIYCFFEDYVYLATGKSKNLFIFYLALGLWDVCAGHALNKEAGGGQYSLDGEEIKYPKSTTSRRLGKVVIITNTKERVKPFVETYKAGGFKLE